MRIAFSQFSYHQFKLIRGLNADKLDGMDAEALWRIGGNSGTTNGVHFLGTTDGKPFELRAAGVGVGTWAPSDRIHVEGGSLRITGSGQAIDPLATGLRLGGGPPVQNGFSWIQSWDGPLPLNPHANNVSIGTASPQAKLLWSCRGVHRFRRSKQRPTTMKGFNLSIIFNIIGIAISNEPPRRVWGKPVDSSRWVWLLVALGLAIFCAAPLLAQEIRISRVTIGSDARVHVEHDADSESYFVLRRGNSLTNIVTPLDLAVGVGGRGQLHDLTAATWIGSGFYRVQKIPLSQPLDTDGDGIDDVWELAHRRPGSALNGLDANEDHTGNGVPDLIDWQRERLPLLDFVQRTSLAREGQSTLTVELKLNNAYSGFAQFGVTGTATAGADYRPVTGNLVINGTNASVTLSLLDDLEIEDTKTILLTLRPSDAVPPKYSLGTASSHVVLLEDNDHRWQGQFVRDGLRLPFELTVAQHGTNIQAALVSDGTSGVPSGTWPVSLRVGGGTFAADIGPIVLPETISLVNVGMVHQFHLEAAIAVNAFEVASLGPTIEGTMREEIVMANPADQHLSRIGNRAILGTFTLQRVSSNLPRNDPTLSILPR